MSIAEIKTEVAALTKSERDDLAAYLAELEALFPADVVEELSRKIDDKDSSRWIPLADACNRLGL
jgi:hypothetical protein